MYLYKYTHTLISLCLHCICSPCKLILTLSSALKAGNQCSEARANTSWLPILGSQRLMEKLPLECSQLPLGPKYKQQLKCYFLILLFFWRGRATWSIWSVWLGTHHPWGMAEISAIAEYRAQRGQGPGPQSHSKWQSRGSYPGGQHFITHCIPLCAGRGTCTGPPVPRTVSGFFHFV